ncbi:LysM peptidoglycan-binding domain-containing protein [Rhodococcus sp. IEGM1300]
MATSQVAVTIYQRSKAGADMLRLPVPPESLNEGISYGYNDFDVFGTGEVTQFGSKKLRQIPLTFLWPRHYNPTFCTRRPQFTPVVAGTRLRRWAQQNEPVKVAFTPIGQLSGLYTIRDLTLEWERPGHVGDLWVSCTLVEYKAPTVRRTSVKATPKPKPQSVKPRQTPPVNSKLGSTTYVVKSGDSLSIIAKKVWGRGGKPQYEALWAANKVLLTKAQKANGARNKYVVYPGQKLVIPKVGGSGTVSSPPKEH